VANLEDAVFWISLAGLFVLTVRGFLRTKKIGRALVYISVLLGCGGTYLTVFRAGLQVQPKGVESYQWAVVLLLYICMLAGMAANHLYGWLSGPKPTRRPFDIGTFLAPMLVSPIVFIPLWVAFQSSSIDPTNLAAPKLMIFLVTFENGFFWKAFFDGRRREHDQ